MSTLAVNYLTLTDWVKRLGKNNKIGKIVELLSLKDDILQDVPFKEGNSKHGEKTIQRVGLPKVYWRMLNQPVPTSKSQTSVVEEGCAMMEAWNEIDAKLVDFAGNEIRVSEASASIQSMSQMMARTIFYGNKDINPKEFAGLSIRYSKLSEPNARNIIDAGGVDNNNTSIWLVVWGSQSIFGIVPKGSKVGLQHVDRGLQTKDSPEGKMDVLRDKFTWDAGLALKDWRYVARICNIDVPSLKTASPPRLLDKMTDATYQIENFNVGKACFYANRSTIMALDKQSREDVKGGGGLTYDNVDGKPKAFFRGIPIKICDSLIEAEERVT